MERKLRDLEGYYGELPNFSWPGGRRLAIQFVLNLEEGGENSIIYGDKHSETFLSEIIGAEPFLAKDTCRWKVCMNTVPELVHGEF